MNQARLSQQLKPSTFDYSYLQKDWFQVPKSSKWHKKSETEPTRELEKVLTCFFEKIFRNSKKK